MSTRYLFALIFTLFWGRSFSQPGELSYHWETVSGVKIFYRTAGNPQHPALILLHGFPSSSIMYQDMIQLLKNDFYLVAPDYPAQGYSPLPPEGYAFTFENISNTIHLLLDQLDIRRYSVFMQDYGSPVGFRLAVKYPERIQALIIQNGNAYIEGFPEAQDPNGELQQYWRDKNKKYEAGWIDAYRTASLKSADQRELAPGVSPDRRNMDGDYAQAGQAGTVYAALVRLW